MHPNSRMIMTLMINDYLNKAEPAKILDVGSYDVNGTYKDLFGVPGWEYTGLDVQAGPNVDVVLEDPYAFPFPDDAFDVVISGQALEHIEFFWKTWAEIVRVTRNGGIIIMIAPFRIREHRYPVDCWRFLPDGFKALARLEGLEGVLRTGISVANESQADTYGVFRK